ncbi:MAG: insulinase family protein [Brumimicrobium sp.]|nr:insulinase family protein [Brumimicrobium sp.]
MKNLFLTIILICSVAYSFGQIDRSIVPTAAPAPEIHIPKPIVFDLDNGMKVILSQDNRIPKVSFNLVMGSDPQLEGNKAGLSDFAGNLLLSGTTNKTKDQIDEEKDFIGADLSANSSSVYLSVLTKHMDKGLTIMADVVKNANFPESEYVRIKKQLESSLYSSKTDPNSMMKNAISKVIFGNEHPYGEVMTEETLNNITREDIINFYKKQYTPAGSYLTIVGDITEDQARNIANKYFGDWEGGVPFTKNYGKGMISKGNRVIFIEKPGAVQSVIDVAFPIDMYPGDDNQIKLSVLNKVFGGTGFGARLMQNLREDKAYTYGAYSTLNINRKGSYLSTDGNFRNDVTDSAIVQFIYEIKRITESLVEDNELSLNKASMAGAFARSLESPRTVANFALNTFRNKLADNYYQNYLKNLSLVSKEDVLDMAKRYFSTDNLYIFVVGNKEVLEKLKQFDTDGEIEILDAFGNLVKEVEFEKSDISLKEVYERYLMAVTQTKTFKKANKKISKVKSMTTVSGASPQQMPVELLMTQYYAAPTNSAIKLEYNGMVFQEEIFNGKEGMTKTMSQTGIDTKKYTAEEVSNKLKTAGLFPEFALLKNLNTPTLLGIEERMGKKFYVVKYVIGDETVTTYYNTENYLKTYIDKLEVSEEGPASVATIISGYENYKGFMFPSQITQMAESMGLDIKIKSIVFNKKIDPKVFEVK